jgi:hypothetical protein
VIPITLSRPKPARVRTYFEQRGIPTPALLVDAGHYFVYKPYFANLYNSNYLEAGDDISRPANIKGWFFATPGHARFPERSFPGTTRSKQASGALSTVARMLSASGSLAMPSCGATGPGCATSTRGSEACERVFAGRPGLVCPSGKRSREAAPVNPAELSDQRPILIIRGAPSRGRADAE